VRRATTAKVTRPDTAATGRMGRNAPAPVATPLPPLKESHTGYMCPVTAITAAAAAAVGPAMRRASHVASEPLRKSSAKAVRPAARPALRMTFVAPTFPLPTVRTSIPFRRATR